MSHPLQKIHSNLPLNSKLLDVGCFGFQQLKRSAALGRNDIKHYGVDYCSPPTLPENFVFHKANLSNEPIPFEDDFFDIVIASHIIEHVQGPIRFFGECIRVIKPGGLLYLEAPSERTMLLMGMPFDFSKFCSLSFFDDPTHLSRPWSPQSLYRLSKYFQCDPLEAKYIVSWKARLALPFLLPIALLLRKSVLLERLVWGALDGQAMSFVKNQKIFLDYQNFIITFQKGTKICR